MFDRRQKPGVLLKLWRFIWPAAGFSRASKYLLHRLSRLPGTPYSLAAGFACGAAASFTPFVGLHFILGGLLAKLMRAGILASAIGTAVGNPWTFPFIWVWIYNLGNWMGFGEKNLDVADMDFPHLFGQVAEAFLNGEFQTVIDLSSPVLWPMFIGGLPTSVAVWFIFYFPLRRLVESYQLRRMHRIARNKKPPVKVSEEME